MAAAAKEMLTRRMERNWKRTNGGTTATEAAMAEVVNEVAGKHCWPRLTTRKTKKRKSMTRRKMQAGLLG
jgi:hypothetical protein